MDVIYFLLLTENMYFKHLGLVCKLCDRQSIVILRSKYGGLLLFCCALLYQRSVMLAFYSFCTFNAHGVLALHWNTDLQDPFVLSSKGIIDITKILNNHNQTRRCQQQFLCPGQPKSMIKKMLLLYQGHASHLSCSRSFSLLQLLSLPLTFYTKSIYSIHRRRSDTMYPKLPKSTNGKLEILKKRTSSAIKKAPRLKSNSAPQPERLPAFADALYELVEAAGDCDFIDNPKMKAFAAFTRVKVHDDYWYTTRVPEGPRTHLVLSKSEPHLGVDVGHLSSAQQMEHIYQDLHEMSFDGLTSSTIDLDPTLPQGQAVVSHYSRCESTR